jgi:hypothetical protein
MLEHVFIIPQTGSILSLGLKRERVMRNVERFIKMRRKIEAGEFLTIQQIEEQHELDLGQIELAVCLGDLYPLRFAGKFYFYTAHVELYVGAFREDSLFGFDDDAFITAL